MAPIVQRPVVFRRRREVGSAFRCTLFPLTEKSESIDAPPADREREDLGPTLAPLRGNRVRQARLGLLFVLVATAVYGSLTFDRGWIAHDEGTIALGAERFLSGELPHRDYNEAYTGGLTILHAVAFRVFGTNLVSLRLVLLLFLVPFAGALYGIARRFVGPLAAVFVALAGIAWSTPNYFASLPSWYNLFFAAFGGLALIRYVETDRVRWIFLAGLCGGLSILFKVIGLYFIAAALLFLAFSETFRAPRAIPGGRRPTAFFLLKAAAGAVFLLAVASLLRPRLGAAELVHFFLPAVALVGVLLADEWKYGGGRFGARLAGLLRLAVPLLAGVLLPVALFAARYVATGALSDLYRGVIVLPQKQVATATFDLPPLSAFLPAIPYGLLLLFPRAIPNAFARRLALVVFLGLVAILALASRPDVYQAIWFSACTLVPVTALAGCVALTRPDAGGESPDRKRPLLFLVLALASLVSLVQFPYAAPIYFCYVAPLVAVAATAIVSRDPATPRPVHAAVLAFYLLYAVLFLNTGYVSSLGHRYVRYVADDRLDLDRGGLRLPKNDAGKYEYLVAAIETHSGGGEIYAGPDCPEVYFLSGRRNPTRSFFEFAGEYSARAESLLPLLEARKTRLVVLNREPDFSEQPDLDLILALRTRYPKMSLIGEFVMMWRD